jgi:CheY-like chemotaxis protein
MRFARALSEALPEPKHETCHFSGCQRQHFESFVADDHELVRLGVRSLLEANEGWKVCGEAVDGREAVEKTRELKPDIVILDVGMPR